MGTYQIGRAPPALCHWVFMIPQNTQIKRDLFTGFQIVEGPKKGEGKIFISHPYLSPERTKLKVRSSLHYG